jgi:cysteine synthase A
MNTAIKNRFSQIAPLIGDTPLLEIRFLYEEKPRRIFAKAENYNLTGSIKDRVALHILKRAYEKGTIAEGDRIIEATSGNTGISFCAIGRYLGHPLTILMPNWMSQERINLMKSFGAEVQLVSPEEGGFLGSISKCEELAKELDGFLPCQFSNEDNVEAHYLTTGDEMARQIAQIGLKADGVVAGVGTGGTIMGIGKRMKEEDTRLQVYPLEPKNSPILSTGCKVGKHRIQGISDEFIPSIMKLERKEDIISVDDGDAIIMAQMLSSQLGLGVGISSGANLIGCIMAQNKLGENSVVATVFPDDNKKYLSTDYAKVQPMKEGYLSCRVKLLDVIAHR